MVCRRRQIGKRSRFQRADVTAGELRARYAALVGGRKTRRRPGIKGRTVGQERVSESRPAVVAQRCEMQISRDESRLIAWLQNDRIGSDERSDSTQQIVAPGNDFAPAFNIAVLLAGIGVPR